MLNYKNIESLVQFHHKWQKSTKYMQKQKYKYWSLYLYWLKRNILLWIIDNVYFE